MLNFKLNFLIFSDRGGRNVTSSEIARVPPPTTTTPTTSNMSKYNKIGKVQKKVQKVMLNFKLNLLIFQTKLSMEGEEM